MKEATRRRLSELILEELSEKIKKHEHLRKKLESFAHLPVEKVADAILTQFDHLLSDKLRELVVHLIEKDVAAEREAERAAEEEAISIDTTIETAAPSVEFSDFAKAVKEGKVYEDFQTGSIMEHFSTKEPFPLEAFTLELAADDWFYLYGFSYAPDSTGKGIPSKMLSLKGIDDENNLFLLDSGDIRFYMNKLSIKNYSHDRTGRPLLTPQLISRYRYQHERILNILRSEEVLVTLPHWVILQGMEEVTKKIEEQYVDMLKGLIEVHDAEDWDVEVFAFDHLILQLPTITEGAKGRTSTRESKHPVSGRRDDKLLDKVIFREKSIAQEIHNQLQLFSGKSKVDFMIRLDTAFMDDWKSILAVRYSVGKDKRKQFCHSVKSLQEEYKEYELMVKVSTPTNQFKFLS